MTGNRKNSTPESISNLFGKKTPQKKAPAYKWQDLALQVINELNVPNFKRSSVFKVCKENDQQFVLNCLNDTKELCQTGERWKYFFKLTTALKSNDKEK